MKKMIAAVLAFAMLAGQAAFAETDTSKLQEALQTVKGRIEIPADMTEFKSRTWSYEDGGLSFAFQWESKDGKKNMEVTADGNGNIQDVNVYDQSWYQNDRDTPRLYSFTKDDAVKMAEEYLRKLVPPAFADENDKFVYDGQTGGGSLSQATYSVSFVRTKNGIRVPDSTARVLIRILNSGAQISSCSVQWDYNAEFAGTEGLLTDGAAVFQEKFPLELTYRKVYQKDDKDVILLEYTLPQAGAAYIDAKTGEILKQDIRDRMYGSAGGAKNAAMALQKDEAADAGLSPEEIAEIENVSGLLGTDELTAKLKAMPELKLSSDMTGLQYWLNKQDEDYFYRIAMNNAENKEKDTQDRYTSAYFNAKTGEIISIYNDNSGIQPIARNEDGTPKKLTAEETAAYRIKAEAFLNKYFADKVAGAKKDEEQGSFEYTQNSMVGVSYQRIIDGIPYPDNSIYAAWSAAADRLSEYSSTWDKDISSAPDKAGAVAPEAAYQAILARNPLEAKYICSKGKYQVAYGLSGTQTTVNAVTGKLIGYDGQELAPKDAETYSDIDGHWAQTMVQALAEYGVRLSGPQFMPDKQILQKDYLTLLCGAANIYYGDEEHMYERLVSRRVLSAADKAPESTLKKEDALKYLLRAMGIQDVAELKGIYICDFQDAGDISEDKLGYCAIAKGFGIVAGDDGMLKPQKELTRAEAITLLYQYLTK